MPRHTIRSRQSRTTNPTGKRARHARQPPAPQPDLQFPNGFVNPSTASGNETERQADWECPGYASMHAQAVASEEAQNALEQAEAEAFSNSESEGDSVCCSTLGAWFESDDDANDQEESKE